MTSKNEVNLITGKHTMKIINKSIKHSATVHFLAVSSLIFTLSNMAHAISPERPSGSTMHSTQISKSSATIQIQQGSKITTRFYNINGARKAKLINTRKKSSVPRKMARVSIMQGREKIKDKNGKPRTRSYIDVTIKISATMKPGNYQLQFFDKKGKSLTYRDKRSKKLVKVAPKPVTIIAKNKRQIKPTKPRQNHTTSAPTNNKGVLDAANMAKDELTQQLGAWPEGQWTGVVGPNTAQFMTGKQDTTITTSLPGTSGLGVKEMEGQSTRDQHLMSGGGGVSYHISTSDSDVQNSDGSSSQSSSMRSEGSDGTTTTHTVTQETDSDGNVTTSQTASHTDENGNTTSESSCEGANCSDESNDDSSDDSSSDDSSSDDSSDDNSSNDSSSDNEASSSDGAEAGGDSADAEDADAGQDDQDSSSTSNPEEDGSCTAPSCAEMQAWLTQFSGTLGGYRIKTLQHDKSSLTQPAGDGSTASSGDTPREMDNKDRLNPYILHDNDGDSGIPVPGGSGQRPEVEINTLIDPPRGSDGDGSTPPSDH